MRKPHRGPARVICGTPYTDSTDSQIVDNWLAVRPQPIAWVGAHGSYLPEAHNRVFEAALALGDIWDRLLMLENDMVIQPNLVAHCRTHKSGLVTGLYFSRRRPHFPIMYKAVNRYGKAIQMDHISMADLVEAPLGEHEVGATGTGILSISRDVIETMPRPWFEPAPQALAEGHYGGHDLYFCAKARALGFTIAYDNNPVMVAEHVGKDRIGLQNYLAEVGALNEMEKKRRQAELDKAPAQEVST